VLVLIFANFDAKPHGVSPSAYMIFYRSKLLSLFLASKNIGEKIAATA
jgi:hypothetical protein